MLNKIDANKVIMNTLAIVDRHQEGMTRLEAVTSVLEDNDIEYTTKSNREATNIIVRINEHLEGPTLVIGAHYDIVRYGSTGLNDNTVSVALLIEVAKNIKTNRKIEIVFYDLEEYGFYGSTLHASTNTVEHALILDVIAYGDTVVMSNKKELNHFVDKQLKDFSVKLDEVLPSDNTSYSEYNIDNTLLCVAPKDDLLQLANGGYIIKRNGGFYSSFHGRANDNDISKLNFDIVEEIGNKILDIYK